MLERNGSAGRMMLGGGGETPICKGWGCSQYLFGVKKGVTYPLGPSA